MPKGTVFLADPPSTGYIVTMIFIALGGTLGLPFMIWLEFTAINSQNWVLVAGALISGLLCAGMLQSWKSARDAIRQRRDGSRYSITIARNGFVYRKHALVHEILLTDIVNITDQAEPSVGGQAWTVRIAYRKADESQSELFINAMDFTKAWEKQVKFGNLLLEAIHADQS
jgi:hypothetical protein